MEITSTKLDLIYCLLENTGYKYTLSTMGQEEEILFHKFNNIHNIEQKFIDWAHNDIASELQGILDDDDTVLEIRIWNKCR